MKYFLVTLLSSILLGASFRALAISDVLNTLGMDDLPTSVVALLVFFFVLIVLLFGLVFWQKHSLKKLATAKQLAFENAPNGLIHISLQGRILAVNQHASALFGRPKENLVGSNLLENFSNDDQTTLSALLNDKKGSANARSRLSKLHLGLTFGDLVADKEYSYIVVSLSNQHSITGQYLAASSHNQHMIEVLQTSGIAQVQIDVIKHECRFDRMFDRLLDINSSHDDADEQQTYSAIEPARQFFERIHEQDISIWTQAIENARQSGKSECRIRLVKQSSLGSDKVYVPVIIDILGVKTPSAPSQTNIEFAKFSLFTLLIRASHELEKHLRHANICRVEQDTLLKLSPFAAYALDEEGKFLWSNAKFDRMLHRIIGKTELDNLFDVPPFPESIMNLHKPQGVVANELESREFELSTERGARMTLVINVSHYAYRERLINKHKRAVLVVVQDITSAVALRDKLALEEDLHQVLELEQKKTKAHLEKQSEELEYATNEIAQYEVLKQDYAQLQSELENEQTRLARFLQFAPVAIATVNRNDQIVSANDVMLNRFKYSEKELKKGNIYKLFANPAEAGTTAKQLNNHGCLKDFHVHLKGKDGKIYPGELKADLIDKNKQEYLFWIVDRADEQFQRDKFELLLQNSKVAMAILDDSGFRKLNKAACEFFNVEDEEEMFALFPFSEELAINSEQASELREILQSIKSEGNAKVFNWEHEINSRRVQCEVTYIPVMKDHAFDSMLCVYKDSNELVQLEEAIQESKRALEIAEQEAQVQQQTIEKQGIELDERSQILNDEKSKAQTLEIQLVDLKGALDKGKAEHEKLTQAKQALQKQLEELQQSHDAYKQAQKDKQAALKEELKVKDAEIEAAKGSLAKDEQGFSKLQQELKEAKQHIDKAKQEQSDAVKRLKSLEEKQSSAEKALKELKAELKQAHDEREKSLEERKALDQELSSLKRTLTQLQKASEDAVNAKEDTEKALAQAQETVASTREELQHLHAQKLALEEQQKKLQENPRAKEKALKLALTEKENTLSALEQNLESSQLQVAKEKRARVAQEKLVEQLHSETEELEQQIFVLESKLQQNALAHDQSHVENDDDALSPYAQIAQLPMPNQAELWFDLLAYLQSNPRMSSISVSLRTLLDDMQSSIQFTEHAIQSEEAQSITLSAKRLVEIAQKSHSDALLNVMESILKDCENDMSDNVSIRWPAAKNSLEKTMRVIYSHIM